METALSDIIIELMNSKNFVLIGLKAEGCSSDSDVFGSFSDDNQHELSIAPNKQIIPSNIDIDEDPGGVVNQFTDIIPNLTALLNKLENYDFTSQKIQEKVRFIPENIVPEEFDQLLEKISNNASDIGLIDNLLDKVDDFGKEKSLPDVIMAQIEILRFKKTGDDEKLKEFEKEDLDSRILALIHFSLADRNDKGKSIYHLVKCLEEYLKNKKVAPIGLLFKDFELKNIIIMLSNDLITKFHSNPLLKSVIDNFSSYVPEVKELNDNSESSSNDNFFESSSSDDNFILELKNIRTIQQTMGPSLQLGSNLVLNPLKQLTPSQRFQPMTLLEPPQTVSYLLEDGTSQMSPTQFQNWIIEIRCVRPESLRIANKSLPSFEKTILQKTKSNPINPPNIGQSDDSQSIEESENYYIDLISFLEKPQMILQQLPSVVSPIYYGLYLPILHTINIFSQSTETKGIIYTKLITMEREAHLGLQANQTERVNRTLVYLKEHIVEEPFEKVEINIIKNKRKQPPLSKEMTDSFINILSICDYEFIVHGRSPLSLEPLSLPISPLDSGSKLDNSRWRANYLFSQYISNEYSPYISFRIAFALALNLENINPQLSTNFIFEAIYTFISNIPGARKLPCSSSALLFFAEMLEKTHKYYYCAGILDNFFLANLRNSTYTHHIAQIALRNNDPVRAVFHYTQAIRHYVSNDLSDKAIYVGQNAASIYIDYGCYSLASSLLSYILLSTYNISVGKLRNKIDVTSLGSLRLPRHAIKVSSQLAKFKPDGSAVNTIITGILLSFLFCKLKLYQQAIGLLDNIDAQTDKMQLKKIIIYCRAFIALKQNNFPMFLSLVPEFHFSKLSLSATSKFSFMSANNFAVEVSFLKLISKAYLERKQFREALFFIEIFIQRCNSNSLTELGEGFYFRGVALHYASEYCYNEIKLFNDNVDEKLGKVIENKPYSFNQVIKMAFSSLAAAKILFSKIDSHIKLAKVNLFILEMMLDYPDIKYEIPKLLTKLPNSDDELQFPIKLEYVMEDPNVLIKTIESQTSLLLNPFLIIHSQILSSIIQFNKSKIQQSETKFGFAYENFFSYFVCGYKFIPSDLPIKTLLYVHHLLQKMCLTLFNFSPEYINEKLVLFDVMNDLSYLIKNYFRKIDNDSIVPIDPSLNISPNIVNLENPRVPSFISLIKDNGFFDNYLDNNTKTITNILMSINANVRLFREEKITQDEMSYRNRSLCDQIEQYSDKIRLQNSSTNPSTTSFKIISTTHAILNGIMFIQKLFNYIIVYIPAKGFIKKHLINSPLASDVTMNYYKETFHFNSHSVLFDNLFIEYIIKLLSFDNKNNKGINTNDYQQALNLTSATIIENIFDSSYKYEIIKDQTPLFGKNKNSNLYTLNTGIKPIIIISSLDLQYIPYEMLMPKFLVIRRQFYLHAILHRSNCIQSIPSLISCKSVFKNHRLVKEQIHEVFEILAGGESSIPFIDSGERSLCYQSLLFENNHDISAYKRKYNFCTFVEVQPNGFPKILNASSSLFVFTYADLCEMPSLVYRLLGEYPFSSFMFIPALSIKKAFKELKTIFHRNNARFSYVKNNEKTEELSYHFILSEDSFQYVTTIQVTLQKKLNIPVPLITPFI